MPTKKMRKMKKNKTCKSKVMKKSKTMKKRMRKGGGNCPCNKKLFGGTPYWDKVPSGSMNVYNNTNNDPISQTGSERLLGNPLKSDTMTGGGYRKKKMNKKGGFFSSYTYSGIDSVNPNYQNNWLNMKSSILEQPIAEKTYLV
jgi:hypothetical protein